MDTGAARDPESPAAAPASPGETAPPARRRRLSEELEAIVHEFDVETVTLREVVAVLHGRGYVLLVMLLTLPFCTPVPLPGLSTPIGFLIALIGVRLALGEKPRLPARLLDKRLPPEKFRRVFVITRRLVLAFEKFLRPRLLWVTRSARLDQLHAVPIVVCALLLLLPLPVPFSNVVPAWAVLLVAGGLLERDGAFIIAGYVSTVVAVVFFVAIAILGLGAVDIIWQWLIQAWRGAGPG
jgi:hypothetical protein